MFGERHVQARLSLADVASIRARIAAGETQTAVRADYGISSGHISEIVTGLKWSEGESPVAAGHAPKPNPEAQSQQESAA